MSNGKTPTNTKKLKCSFCDKTQDEVRRLVAGPGVYICNECVALCQSVLDGDFQQEVTFDLDSIPKPKEIKEIQINM